MEFNFMEEFFSDKNKAERMEKDLIIRKSLLKGQSSKVAKDNVNLRANLRNLAKDFLRNSEKDGNSMSS